MSSPLHTPKIVEKPWGREVWYADSSGYAGKVLEVKAGCRLSLQYHERKTETLFLLSGKMLLTFRTLGAKEVPTASLITAADQHVWTSWRPIGQQDVLTNLKPMRRFY